MAILVPVDDDAIVTQARYVIVAAADCYEPLIFLFWGAAIHIAAPADGSAIRAQPAGVPPAAAYGYEEPPSRGGVDWPCSLYPQQTM